MGTANSNETVKHRQGQFVKGQSGNPSGRPKTPDEIKEMFALKTPDAVKKLIEMIDNETTPPQVKLSAIKEVLDRTLGKPMQDTNVNIANKEDKAFNIDMAHFTIKELRELVSNEDKGTD